MSLFITLLLMLLMGLLGGVTNYALAKTASSSAQPNFWHGVLIGLGATILVPLFLELAQSKLLDEIRPEWELSETHPAASKPEATTKPVSSVVETAKPATTVQTADSTKKAPANPPLKTYLLFSAYCFLAAVAGPRFINSLIEGVLKEKEIARLNRENNQISEEKEQVENKVKKQNAVNDALAKEEEAEALKEVNGEGSTEAFINSKIGSVLHPDDPQKGRFGGERERNFRRLCAKVQPGATPGLFRLDLWVESTDDAHPLNSDVIFYLHNTFRPSVFTIKAAEFKGDKATVEPKTTWGAFTVGAVTDNGKTMLEYDLASDKSFPDDFRLK